MSAKSILKDSSIAFLEQYLNNASPTGFEAEGQKIWMDYVKPVGIRLTLQVLTVLWLVGCAAYAIQILWKV